MSKYLAGGGGGAPPIPPVRKILSFYSEKMETKKQKEVQDVYHVVVKKMLIKFNVVIIKVLLGASR